jgi:hypothetical protein
VLNVNDLAAERAFYDKLGCQSSTKARGTQTSAASAPKRCTSASRKRRRSAGISFELENNSPASGWAYRRLLIRTPSGYRLALEMP